MDIHKNKKEPPKPKGERMGWKPKDEVEAPIVIRGKKVQIDGQANKCKIIIK